MFSERLPGRHAIFGQDGYGGVEKKTDSGRSRTGSYTQGWVEGSETWGSGKVRPPWGVLRTKTELLLTTKKHDKKEKEPVSQERKKKKNDLKKRPGDEEIIVPTKLVRPQNRVHFNCTPGW